MSKTKALAIAHNPSSMACSPRLMFKGKFRDDKPRREFSIIFIDKLVERFAFENYANF